VLVNGALSGMEVDPTGVASDAARAVARIRSVFRRIDGGAIGSLVTEGAAQ
jgi:hypothetical protein